MGCYCEVEGCIELTHSRGMCRVHSRARAEGRGRAAPAYSSPRERVVEAILAVADAETDVEFKRAMERHRMAVDAWRMPAWQRRKGRR
jgi:hypothetical protein